MTTAGLMVATQQALQDLQQRVVAAEAAAAAATTRAQQAEQAAAAAGTTGATAPPPQQRRGVGVDTRTLGRPETYLGEEITEAVITVPAYFNDS